MRCLFLFSLLLTTGLTGLLICRDGCRAALAPSFETAEMVQPSSTPPSSPEQMPTETNWPQFLESVRQIALAYNDALPDFTCSQFVQRMAKFGGMGDWQMVDELVVEVSYRGKSEHYRILTRDKKPLPSNAKGKIGGFLSQGDFGNALRLLFTPESNASFRRDGI
jgi:hypothetical protein